MNSSKKNPSKSPNTSTCFSSIIERFICSGNLPTHPSPPEDNVSNNNGPKVIAVKSRVQAQGNPGIVARLMGLDSLPDNAKSLVNESLLRSKSLNSLHFLPDFDPTRTSFHRRARTSSTSFCEQGNSFLCRVDENLETNGDQMKVNESSRSKKISECKKRYQQEHYYRGNNNGTTSSCMLNKVGCNNKNNTRRKCEIHKRKIVDATTSVSLKSRVTSGINGLQIHKRKIVDTTTSVPLKTHVTSGVNTVQITKRKIVDDKDKTKKNGSIISSKNKVIAQSEEVLQSDIMSTSPISILDHQLEFHSPLRDDANATKTTPRSNSKKILPLKINKINICDDMARQHIHPESNRNEDDSSIKTVASKHKLANEEAKLAEYFVRLSGQICTLAEDQICKDIIKYDLFKDHFIEEICRYLGREMVEFLLNELTNELVGSPL